MQSMTGFGEGRAGNERLAAVATLRTVNHRFLDVSVRVPEEYRVLEPSLVQRLRGGLERGRVELKVSVRLRGECKTRIEVDEEAAVLYIEAANRLAERAGVAKNLASGDLLRLPEVVSVEVGDAGVLDQDKEVVARAVEEAFEQLLGSRSREGAELAGVLQKTVDELDGVVKQLDASRDELQRNLYEKTRKRLEVLADEAAIDEVRLVQEVALLVDRADVQEEIDRLNVHVDRFRSLLDGKNAVGKRLDFLAQEILRELNTVGSKCRNSEVIQLVLEGKVLCERLREQVQNVE